MPKRLSEEQKKQMMEDAWLKIHVEPENLFNPLSIVPDEFADDPYLYIIWLMQRPEYFSFVCKEFFNIQILPIQAVVLSQLWKYRFPMLIGSRGFSKSFSLAIHAFLRALLIPERKVVIAGAAFRQSKIIFEYCENIWNNSPILRDMCSHDSGFRHDTDLWRFKINDSIISAIPIGDGCALGDTLITYEDCFGRIDRFSESKTRNIKVWSNGEFRNSDECYYNGIKSTVKIKTKKGFEFSGTNNHELKILRNGNIQFCRLDKMVVGDTIIIDISKRWHSGRLKFNYDEAYSLGLMIGDGLPEPILAADKDSMSACLRGVFDADGDVFTSTEKGGMSISVNLTSTSQTLIKQIQYILLHYGIIASVRSRIRKVNHNRVHELMISGRDVKIFADEIGFGLNRKQDVLINAIRLKKRFNKTQDIIPDMNCYFDEIRSIEDNGEHHTFDMHVPIAHEYGAGGFYSHNSKIRGLRAHDTFIDEFSSISREIVETVIQGFGVVKANLVESVNLEAQRELAKKLNIDVDLDEKMEGENQTIFSGTAYYDFNHFADYWKKWREIIRTRGDESKLKDLFGDEKTGNWKDFCVIRIPFELIPKGVLDAEMVARARASMHSGTYANEYGAVFSKDSNGFYKRSLIEGCTGYPNKPLLINNQEVYFNGCLYGSNKNCVMGVDPASEIDNFSIVIVEEHDCHRRVLYCWTINKKMHRELVSKGLSKNKDFYAHCSRKIRELMKRFNIVRIMMDSQGGGVAIREDLQDDSKLEDGEMRILPVIEYDKPKDTDAEHGLHILELVNFASAEWTSEANHMLKKDMEDKVLTFPYFDTVSVSIAELSDKENDLKYDSLENCCVEIEILKDELTTIIITSTPTGKDKWDTPEIKLPGNKKGKQRKDRYSSLLMANMGARLLSKVVTVVRQSDSGGFAESISNEDKVGPLYRAPDWFLRKIEGVYD